MANETPRLKADVDLRQLSLTPVETFLLSRVDGRTSVDQLVHLVRLPEAIVHRMLARFVREGVLSVAPAASAPTAPAPAQAAPGPDQASAVPTIPDDPSDQAASEAATEGATHRALFETRLRTLDEEARVALAAHAHEPELSALCFDPLPRVVQRLLENARAALAHARLIAAHHRDPRGLEALAARAELFRDAQVQRLLLRNPQFPEALLRRMLASRRMLDIYKIAISREATERAKRTAMQTLRQRFASGAAEERVELIFNTEGRALGGLAGIAVDGKTVALLCARSVHSTLLIQNIARWAAAPPPLIAHLLKQPVVRRQPQLRAALARHPNAPSDAR
ncbi:MAG: hypothetical protein WBV82_04925 [Myxococcaceae bacterium]